MKYLLHNLFLLEYLHFHNTQHLYELYNLLSVVFLSRHSHFIEMTCFVTKEESDLSVAVIKKQ